MTKSALTPKAQGCPLAVVNSALDHGLIIPPENDRRNPPVAPP